MMMGFERPLVITILCLVLKSDNVQSNSSGPSTTDEIHDLSAEPDYRAVQLKWTYTPDRQTGFRIRYCEITSWNSKSRCKEQIVGTQNEFTEGLKEQLEADDAVIDLREPVSGTFHASLTNLRMLTNYSISVWPTSIHNYSSGQGAFNEVAVSPRQDLQIFVETKSFSARTSRCLANSSEIEVQTGPFFRGKISVEGAGSPECAMYGNRTSDQNLYRFVINNEACGARLMNNSRIETMVIVHENKEILTHNSRRYLVICTFHPEIHSLTASVSVPSHLLKKVFERLRDRNYHVSSAKKATRNKMKRYSQSSSSSSPSSTSSKQPFRDSRALSSSSSERDRSSDKLAFTSNQSQSSSSPPSSSSSSSPSPDSPSSSSLMSSSTGSQSSVSSYGSLSLAGREYGPSMIDMLAEHKFILSSVIVLLLCLTVSVYLLVSHYRCSRSHYTHDHAHHHRRYRHHEVLHNSLHRQHPANHPIQQQQQQHRRHHHHQHRLTPNVPFDKRRHFDSLDAVRKDSIFSV